MSSLSRVLAKGAGNAARLIKPHMDLFVDSYGKVGEFARLGYDRMDTEAHLIFNRGAEILKPVLGLSRKAAKDVDTALRIGNFGGLDPDQLAAAKAARDYLDYNLMERVYDGPKVKLGPGVYRDVQPIQNYVPDVMDSKVRRILAGRADDPERIKLEDDYVNFFLGQNPSKTRKEALEALQAELDFSGAKALSDPTYAGLRRPHDVGLPESWRMPLKEALAVHNLRSSYDLAYHRHIEKNPILAKLFGIKNDGRGNAHPDQVFMQNTGITGFDTGEEVVNRASDPIVRDLLSYISRMKTGVGLTLFDQLSAMTNAGRLGTLTAVRDFVSAKSILPEIMTTKELAQYPAALAKYILEPGNMFKAGAMREYKAMSDQFLPGDITSWFSTATHLLRTVQGRNLLEKASRGSIFELGRMVTPGRLAAKDAKFFDTLKIPDWQDISVDELRNRVGKRLMEHVQGSYSPMDQPMWILPGGHSSKSLTTGALAATFSLWRWPMGRANSFVRNQVRALKAGNPFPFIKAFGGAFLGAEAMHYLKKELQPYLGQQPNEMTLPEWARADFKDAEYTIAAKLATTGFAGVMSELAWRAVQMKHGEAVLGAKYPLLIMGSEAQERVGQWLNALQEKTPETIGDWIGEVSDLGFEIAKDNFQMARLLLKDTPQNIGAREERMYKRIFGKGTGSSGARQNPFTVNRKFLDAKTTAEAVEGFPELVGRYQKTGAVPTVPSAFVADIPGKVPFYPWAAGIQRPEDFKEMVTTQARQEVLNEQKRNMLEGMRQDRQRKMQESKLRTVDMLTEKLNDLQNLTGGLK